ATDRFFRKLWSPRVWRARHRPGTDDMSSSGIFVFTVALAPNASKDAVQTVIDDLIERIKAGRVSAAELERAKNQFLLASYAPLAKNLTIGQLLGDGWYSTGDPMRKFEIIEKTRK